MRCLGVAVLFASSSIKGGPKKQLVAEGILFSGYPCVRA